MPSARPRDFYRLATRCLSAEASVLEQRRLLKLLQDPAKQALFAELQRYWAAAAPPPVSFNLRTAMKQLRSRLAVERKAAARKQKPAAKPKSRGRKARKRPR